MRSKYCTIFSRQAFLRNPTQCDLRLMWLFWSDKNHYWNHPTTLGVNFQNFRYIRDMRFPRLWIFKSRYFRLWRRVVLWYGKYGPPKRWCPITAPHGVTTQKTWFWIRYMILYIKHINGQTSIVLSIRGKTYKTMYPGWRVYNSFIYFGTRMLYNSHNVF